MKKIHKKLVIEAEEKTIYEILRFVIKNKKDHFILNDLNQYIKNNFAAEENLLKLFRYIFYTLLFTFAVVWVWIDFVVMIQGTIFSFACIWVLNVIDGYFQEKFLDAFLTDLSKMESIREATIERAGKDEMEVFEAYKVVYIHSKISLMTPEERQGLLF
jgi:hypothetical protein